MQNYTGYLILAAGQGGVTNAGVDRAEFPEGSTGGEKACTGRVLSSLVRDVFDDGRHIRNGCGRI